MKTCLRQSNGAAAPVQGEGEGEKRAIPLVLKVLPMLNDSERFAFTARRYHGFATTGNAYDATQVDVAIGNGDTLLILPEQVVGVAHCWPFAVTVERGKLHGVAPKPGESAADFAAGLGAKLEDIEAAITLAEALSFPIDPVLAALLAA